MWQRKQTIYLILVIFLMALTIFFVDPQPTNHLSLLHYFSGMVIGLAAVAIQQFKNRKMQQLMCNLSIILTVLGIGFFGYDHFVTKGKDVSQLPFGVVLPVVAIACLFMAKAGIRHDENLIRSMDRIR